MEPAGILAAAHIEVIATQDLPADGLPRQVVLRPMASGPGPGKRRRQVGRYLFEYRRRAGWDRALNA